MQGGRWKRRHLGAHRAQFFSATLLKASNPWPSELVESISRLYTVFASYKANRWSIGICGNCVSASELEALFAKPLRELDAKTIHVFAIIAVATHGSVTDYKYFLPRICELLPNELWEIDAPEIYLSNLQSADWLAWPEEEMLAVPSFLFEWWRWTLSTYPASLPGLGATSAIAQAGNAPVSTMG